MNYTQIVSFKFQENGQRLSSERVKTWQKKMKASQVKNMKLVQIRNGSDVSLASQKH